MKPHDWIALAISAAYMLAVVVFALRSRPVTALVREQLPSTWRPRGGDGR